MMRYLLICFAFLFALNAQADEVAVPTLKQRVTDLTGTLDPNQQAALESRLAQYEQVKGSQIAILIVPSTQPEAIEQYSIRVTDAWKIGRKGVDDGLLILVAKNDRKMRIEVGYGLEGVIPDAIAKRIIAETITPFFKQGDYYGGLNAGLDQIFVLVNGEALPLPAQHQAQDTSLHGLLPMLLFGGVMVGMILRAIFGSFVGGAITGGVIGFLVWVLGGGFLFALVLGFIAFVVTLAGIFNGGPSMGGFSGGGGGGFSGGGGGFGGGGASGDW